MISKILAVQTKIAPSGLPNVDNAGVGRGDVSNLLSIAFGIIGALAFLVIVIAGLRYVVAAGDPQKTVQARNTITFALIGLVVAISAEAVVAFVVKRI